MTLADISDLSQAVAAVAVVVSLIYLAVQVRQTERNQRAMMQQVRTDRGIGLSMCWSEPHMAALMTKVLQDVPALSAQEAAQLIGYVRSLALNLLDARGLHAMKLLSDEAFERACAGSRWFFAMPTARAAWSVVRVQFTPEDADGIEAMVMNAPLVGPTDQGAAVRHARDALRAQESAPQAAGAAS